MIRFAHLREAYLHEVYRQTFSHDGVFRFQNQYDPVPEQDIAAGLLHTCLLGLIKEGFVEFRKALTGAHDGFEITAAGIEYVESQFEEDENRPRPDTALDKALKVILPQTEAMPE